MLSHGFFPGGPSGLSRLQRDVVEVAGATDALLLIGINDLGVNLQPSADALIGGLKTAVEQLRRAGLRVIVGTITPARGTLGFLHGRASVDAARQQVNQWIRGSGVPNAVVDFDTCLRDPAAPSYLRAEFDSGDHIHPNTKGYEAMANCVDLRLLP